MRPAGRTIGNWLLTDSFYRIRISMMRKEGFTLVELMVAIGVLMVVSLLIIPNVWRARINSNESIAVSSLKSLNSALQLYYINNDKFPESLTYLVPPESNLGYIDPELTQPEYRGYSLVYESDGLDSFEIEAAPRRPGYTGNRCFYMDEAGEVRYQEKDDCPAGPGSPVLR